VTDVEGAATIVAGSAIIADAVLAASATQPTVNTTEAGLFPVPVFGPSLFHGPVASFTDGNPTAPPSDFTATIDWGDGTPLTAGTVSQPGGVGTAFIVSGAHTYVDSGVTTGTGTSGTYPIQVFVVDVGGSRLTMDNTAHVADNSIALTGALNPASDSGLSTGTVDTTNVTQPDFTGKSEPLIDRHPVGDPASQRDSLHHGQVEAGSDGSWNIKSDVPLVDGHYKITATAIDQSGETVVTTPPSPVVITSDLLIDTTGPVIDGVFFQHEPRQAQGARGEPQSPQGTEAQVSAAPRRVSSSKPGESHANPMTMSPAGGVRGRWGLTPAPAAPAFGSARGDARKGVPYRDRSLGEGDQAADRNSRLRILARSSTRFILGISSRSIAV
jgi:Bacterial Ig-like domain